MSAEIARLQRELAAVPSVPRAQGRLAMEAIVAFNLGRLTFDVFTFVNDRYGGIVPNFSTEPKHADVVRIIDQLIKYSDIYQESKNAGEERVALESIMVMSSEVDAFLAANSLTDARITELVAATVEMAPTPVMPTNIRPNSALKLRSATLPQAHTRSTLVTVPCLHVARIPRLGDVVAVLGADVFTRYNRGVNNSNLLFIASTGEATSDLKARILDLPVEQLCDASTIG